MVLSVLALLVLVGSTLLILSNLRMVARDTFDVINKALAGRSLTEEIVPAAAFALLWIVIFAACTL